MPMSSRIAAQVGAVLAAALVAAVAPTAAAMPSPTPAPVPAPAPLSVATFNFGPGPYAPEKAADLAAIARTADVIGGQEAGDQLAAIDAFLLAHPTWAAYYGSYLQKGRPTPILYDTEVLELRRGRASLTWEGGYVGPAGAGPATLGAKHLLWAVFVHRESGRRVHVINQHLIASVTRPRISADERARRSAAYSKQIAGLVKRTKRSRGIVVATGDFNALKGFPLLAPLWEIGYTADNVQPTFKSRAIDLVWVRDRRNHVTPVGEQTLRTSSDHRAAVMSYAVTRRDGF